MYRVSITHPLKDIWVVFSILLLKLKLLKKKKLKESCSEYLCTGFCVNVNFHFSRVDTQECNCWDNFCLINSTRLRAKV